MAASDHLSEMQFFHGTDAKLATGDMLSAEASSARGGLHTVFVTRDREYADRWAARRAGMARDYFDEPDAQPHVYEVEPHGEVTPDQARTGYTVPAARVIREHPHSGKAY